jgi:hypothetical protein
MDQMFVISDSVSSGTWARTDPCDGIWYRRGHRPREGGRWILNGTNVDIDCARKAALYAGRFKGQSQTWSTWLHARAGFWIPSLISQPWRRDSFSGLPRC